MRRVKSRWIKPFFVVTTYCQIHKSSLYIKRPIVYTKSFNKLSGILMTHQRELLLSIKVVQRFGTSSVKTRLDILRFGQWNVVCTTKRNDCLKRAVMYIYPSKRLSTFCLNSFCFLKATSGSYLHWRGALKLFMTIQEMHVALDFMKYQNKRNSA